jgi:acyl-CoA thioesterase-1
MRSIVAGTIFFLWVLVPGVSMAADPPVILVLGDSLSAGYGMQRDEAWPTLLQRRLDDNGHSYRVHNASITGETTQGGLGRLPTLPERYAPAVAIIELGGNDGLRGFSQDITRGNLSRMTARAREAGATVMITEIMLPPNYGPAYTERFSAMYGDVARQHEALLVPFFLRGVALVDGMIQADGVHPTAAAQPVLLDNVWNVLQAALDAAEPVVASD